MPASTTAVSGSSLAHASVSTLPRTANTGAIVFSRLVAMLSQVEASGTKLNYPPDTCAELCWMGIHGLVAAFIMKPDFPWSNRELLISAMLDIHLKGIVRGD